MSADILNIIRIVEGTNMRRLFKRHTRKQNGINKCLNDWKRCLCVVRFMDTNVILQGDAIARLKELPTESVACCVTSPPYWGLRDYGVEGQLGLEKTPEEYVQKLVSIFREVRRVLRPDGTLWLNLGDSYCGTGNKGDLKDPKYADGRNGQKVALNNKIVGLKSKDLVGIPWMVAFALRADGWYLRSDIIWAKPNPMPESVTDRPTKAHEYIFLLSKEKNYYYDAEAIKEPVAQSTIGRGPVDFGGEKGRNYHPEKGDPNYRGGNEQWGRTFDYRESCVTGRNKRSVWAVTTKPFKEAHFATFPPDLIRPCILAGCPQWVCPTCGKARERIVENGEPMPRIYGEKEDEDLGLDDVRKKNSQKWREWKEQHPDVYKGLSDCGCGAGFVPGVVFDPFMGAGTTALVALEEQRKFIGIELNQAYIEIAMKRLKPLLEQKTLIEV